MTDNEIGEALKGLQRTSPSPRFTSEVLRAARGRSDTRPVWRYAAAFALTLSLTVVGVHGMRVRADHERRLALRAEHERIESELRQVKTIAGEQRPVLVLENDDARFIIGEPARSTPASSQSIIY